MTQTIAIEKQINDIAIHGGNILLARDLQAVAMLCKHAALTLKGEEIFAVDEGLPNFELVWNGSPRLRLWENELRAAIQAVPDVIAIEAINVVLQEKTLYYQAIIKTAYGIANIGNMIDGL